MTLVARAVGDGGRRWRVAGAGDFDTLLAPANAGRSLKPTNIFFPTENIIDTQHFYAVHFWEIDRIEVERHGRVRRAKLYYLRDLRGKAARIEEKRKG